jgi:hypothetical protein
MSPVLGKRAAGFNSCNYLKEFFQPGQSLSAIWPLILWYLFFVTPGFRVGDGGGGGRL